MTSQLEDSLCHMSSISKTANPKLPLNLKSSLITKPLLLSQILVKDSIPRTSLLIPMALPRNSKSNKEVSNKLLSKFNPHQKPKKSQELLVNCSSNCNPLPTKILIIGTKKLPLLTQSPLQPKPPH